MLDQDIQNYAQQLDAVKAIRNDLKDAKAEHPLAADIELKTKELKQLRSKQIESANIAELKSKLETEMERLELLREIVAARMAEAGEEETTLHGLSFKMVPVLKIGRDKKL